MEAISVKVNADIMEFAKSAGEQKKLDNEVDFERAKFLNDRLKEEKEEAKAKKPKAKAKAKADAKDQPATSAPGSLPAVPALAAAAAGLEESVAEGCTAITSILLVFLNAADATAGVKKPGKNRAFAMTLWEDGPEVTACTSFQQADKFIMKEYNVAKDRGAMECGCSMCTNRSRLTAAKHKNHSIWHAKYRKYYVLRQAAFPGLKDMDETKTGWTIAEQQNLLYALVELWKQVDGTAPWFLSAAYLTQQANANRMVQQNAVEVLRKAKAAKSRRDVKSAAIAAAANSVVG